MKIIIADLLGNVLKKKSKCASKWWTIYVCSKITKNPYKQRKYNNRKIHKITNFQNLFKNLEKSFQFHNKYLLNTSFDAEHALNTAQKAKITPIVFILTHSHKKTQRMAWLHFLSNKSKRMMKSHQSISVFIEIVG